MSLLGIVCASWAGFILALAAIVSLGEWVGRRRARQAERAELAAFSRAWHEYNARFPTRRSVR